MLVFLVYSKLSINESDDETKEITKGFQGE